MKHRKSKAILRYWQYCLSIGIRFKWKTNWNNRQGWAAWKVPKYGVIFGPCFPVFGLNTDQKWLRVWTLLTECNFCKLALIQPKPAEKSLIYETGSKFDISIVIENLFFPFCRMFGSWDILWRPLLTKFLFFTALFSVGGKFCSGPIVLQPYIYIYTDPSL